MTNVLSRVFSDRLAGFLVKTGHTFTAKVGGAAVGFLFSVLVARFLGAAGAGSFFLALTIVRLVTVPGRLGQDFAALRLVASAADQGRWPRVRAIFRESHTLVLVLGLLAGGVLYAFAAPISRSVFEQPGLTGPLRVLSVAVPVLTLLPVLAGSLRGIELAARAEIVQRAVLPAGACLVFLVFGHSLGPLGASLSYALGGLCALGVGLYFWGASVPSAWSMPSSAKVRRQGMKIGLPLIIVASLNLVTSSADTVVLGIFRDADDVGVYQAAFKLAMLSSFVLGAVNSVVAPKFSQYHGRGSQRGLAAATKFATRIIVVGTLPLVALLLLVPDLALRVFGSEFTEGATALRILCVGQAGRALAGTTGYLLMMTGNETALRNNVTAVTILNVAANFALVPLFGATGAAVATAGTEIVKNAVNVWLVKRRLGIGMWSWIGG